MSGNWTRAVDVKSQIQRLWDRGDILAEAVCGESAFPRRLVMKAPTASEMSARFDEVRKWIADVRSWKNCRIESRVTNHRQLGNNEVPAEIWIDSVEDALIWLGKRAAFRQFVELAELTRGREPQLIDWLRANSLNALEHAAVWPNLLEVVAWMRRNPRPNIYIREVDLPNIDSKFIEQHRAVLAELFDAVLPPDCIDATVSGVSQFAKRYGFKTEREKIRFRILDSACGLFGAAGGDQDISLDVETFAELRPRVRRVFITENKTNFLAFPSVPESMVIFGSGYGWDALARAHWLFHCDIFYWGDIDTHGFAILNQLRSAFPHVRSLLMDEATTREFAHLAVEETKPTDSVLDSLMASESSILALLRSGTLSHNFRLEQERIDWTYARTHIQLAADSAASVSHSSPREQVSSADITAYFNPSRCAKRMTLLSDLTLCRRLRRPDPAVATDPPSELTILLGELSSRHRSESIAQLSSLTDLSHIDDIDAHDAATLAAVTSRSPAIRAPLLTVSAVIAGIPVTIYAQADLLRLNSSNQYEAIDFKLTRQTSHHPELVLNLSLFAWAFNQVFDARLGGLSVQNPHDPPLSISPNVSGALRTVADIIHARSLPADHYTPVGWSKCSDCSFRTHCWSNAVSGNDVSLLPDIDQDLATALHRSGVQSINALLEHFNATTLSSFQYRSGSKNVRVGKRADAILTSARSLVTNSPIWSVAAPALPSAPTFAVIDFEGLPPLTVPQENVYLWGLQLFGDDASGYTYSFAAPNGPDSDLQAWLRFLTLCQAVLDSHSAIHFLHYHHYEVTMLRKYIERYGDQNSVAARVLERCVDLHSLVRQSANLPIHSYGLKEVERCLGFARSQSNYGGDWSIAAFARAVQDQDTAILDEIRKYNAEDIQATWFVFNFLREHTPAASVLSP